MALDHRDENEIERSMDEARNLDPELESDNEFEFVDEGLRYRNFEAELEQERARQRQRDLEVELELYRRKQEILRAERKNAFTQKIISSATLLASLAAVVSALMSFLIGTKYGGILLDGWTVPALSISIALFGLTKIWADGFGRDSNSFVELDKRTKNEKSRYTPYEGVTLPPDLRSVNLATIDSVVGKGKSRAIAGGLSFVEHMRAVIESLDYQIDYAEEKASTLLDIGRRFVRWGIWLYVLSILVWQLYIWSVNFMINPGIVAGMISCSVLFVIVEFLGAWYLKQYRHYGDSAFSYMKVRSSYNKYMLAYCAVVEFSGDGQAKAKKDILKVLSEPEKWPEFREVASNDFNYMLQSVESLGTVFEKLKGVFGRSGSKRDSG